MNVSRGKIYNFISFRVVIVYALVHATDDPKSRSCWANEILQRNSLPLRQLNLCLIISREKDRKTEPEKKNYEKKKHIWDMKLFILYEFVMCKNATQGTKTKPIT